MKIADKTILITGASQGLGRRLAIHFAARGANIILAARNEANLKEAANAVEKAGGTCTYYVMDLRKRSDIEDTMQRIKEKGQRIDILINNAADVTSKPFIETTFEEIDRLVHTNIIGALQLTRLVVPGMVAQHSGMLVDISSLAGYKPNPAQTVYSISKAGVNGMSDALRAELRGTGVHVMNVALSSVGDKPGQVPIEEFARKLETAIHNETPELFLSLVTKWLMRLYRFLPGLARLR